ncbi:MAG: zf-HC2 domain-containing protein, partial [Planctomycetota bacterium]
MSEGHDPQTDERLSAYLDDELTEDERADFEALLASRPDYQEAVTQWQRMRESLRQLPAQQLGDTAHQELMRRLRKANPDAPSTTTIEPTGPSAARQGNRGWQTRALAVVATLAACLLIAFALNPLSNRRELAQHEEAAAGEEASDALMSASRAKEVTLEEGAEDRFRVAPTVEATDPTATARSVRETEMMVPESMFDASTALSTNEGLAPNEGVDAGSRVAAAPDGASSRITSSSPFSASRITDSRETGWDAGDEARGRRSRLPTMHNTREPIPEIVLQANNRRVYDELLAALASADSETPGRDDQLQGYHEVRDQQLPGAVQAAAVVQVLEVTGTTSDVAELVESAQNQGAVLLNAAVVEPQLPELGMRSQRKQEPKRVLTLES